MLRCLRKNGKKAVKNTDISPVFIDIYLLTVGKILLAALVLVLAVKFALFDIGRVKGQSMEPNFHDHDLFFTNKAAYWLSAPARFDAVQVVDYENKRLMIKRVVALPGETVTVKDGRVTVSDTVDGAAVDAWYASTVDLGEKIYHLRAHEYFVLGDNYAGSYDSRNFGPVHRSRIVGRVERLKWRF